MNAFQTQSYLKAQRLQRTIFLPFVGNNDDYQKMVLSASLFREFLQACFSSFPELFPPTFSSGFQMKDFYFSKKIHLSFRRILLGKIAYSIRPSFVLPYMTALAPDITIPLFLRKFSVPYWGLAFAFKRNAHYWHRLECSLGRMSLLATTISDSHLLPSHLAADEKIAFLRGEQFPLAMITAKNCVLAVEPSESLKQEDLQKAYQVFKTEAHQVNASYSPKTVNLDGWDASWNAWKTLFPKIVIIRCFLHLYLTLRKIFTQKQVEAYEQVSDKLWYCYHALTKGSFSQRVRRVFSWSQKMKGIIPKKMLDVLNKMHKHREKYSVAYDYEGAYRTSNQVDRLMQRLEKKLYDMKYFKGTIETARLHIRGWALIQNFSPWNPITMKKYKGWRSPVENLNQKRYHEDWLQNLLVSSCAHNFRPSPQIPSQ